MNIVDDIRYRFRNGNAIIRIIFINVAVFVLIALINVGLALSSVSPASLDPFLRWLQLPAHLTTFLTRPWTIITYMFLHNPFDLFHIVFNMLWLYWIGNILHEYLGNKKVYAAYFGGGIAGGLFFILCYNIFPAFSNSVQTTYAIGASAGVLAIVVATATLLPDYPIQLLLFGMVRLKWLALVSVVLDLISIPSGNAGGHLAHLGGAFFGFMYIKYIYGKVNLPEWMTQAFAGRSKLKVHHSAKASGRKYNAGPTQEDIDMILDKISRSGYDSLTKKEKEILFKASKD